MGRRPPDLKDRSAMVRAACTPRPGADVLWEEISDDLGEPRAVPREREPRLGPPPAPGSGLWGAQPPSFHAGVGSPGRLGRRRSCSCTTGQTRLRRSPGAEAGFGPSCTCASLFLPRPRHPDSPTGRFWETRFLVSGPALAQAAQGHLWSFDEDSSAAEHPHVRLIQSSTALRVKQRGPATSSYR